MPFCRLFGIILVKWLVIGRFTPGPKGMWEHLQFQLMKELKVNAAVQHCTSMLGRHYHATTLIMRALGVRCGERIFWPGVMPSLIEFDLLTIGDDVTFGSRSTILCSTNEENAQVKLYAKTPSPLPTLPTNHHGFAMAKSTEAWNPERLQGSAW